MEPRIQYAKTADGVSIACSELGSGLPLIAMPNYPISHLQVEWDWPEYRHWYERLADGKRLIRYDGRGSGLSDRDVGELPLQVHVLDLEAVADRLALDRFALFAPVRAGPAAIAYAAEHPDRVSHLILWISYARAADYLKAPQVEALLALLDKDWGLFTDAASHFMYGWSAPDQASRYAALIRAAVAPDVMRASVAAANDVDVSGLLARVTVPTLVAHREQFSWLPAEVAKQLASQIADAQLAVIDEPTSDLFPQGMDPDLREINRFLGLTVIPVPEPSAGSDIYAILFTDIAGSTSLTQRLGDRRAHEVLLAHNAIVRRALKDHGGNEVKHTGDGIMASFSSASRGLACAVDLQDAVASYNQGQTGETLAVRVGLNAGEPVAEDADLFGTAVQIARRVCDQAQAGEVLISDVVRQLTAGKGFLFADRGDATLRGFEEPVRLYEVRWQEDNDREVNGVQQHATQSR